MVSTLFFAQLCFLSNPFPFGVDDVTSVEWSQFDADSMGFTFYLRDCIFISKEGVMLASDGHDGFNRYKPHRADFKKLAKKALASAKKSGRFDDKGYEWILVEDVQCQKVRSYTVFHGGATCLRIGLADGRYILLYCCRFPKKGRIKNIERLLRKWLVEAEQMGRGVDAPPVFDLVGTTAGSCCRQ